MEGTVAGIVCTSCRRTRWRILPKFSTGLPISRVYDIPILCFVVVECWRQQTIVGIGTSTRIRSPILSLSRRKQPPLSCSRVYELQQNVKRSSKWSS